MLILPKPETPANNPTPWITFNFPTQDASPAKPAVVLQDQEVTKVFSPSKLF